MTKGKGKEYATEPIINVEAKPHPDLRGSQNLPWRNGHDDDTGGEGTSSIPVPNLAMQLLTCNFDGNKIVNGMKPGFPPQTDIRTKCFNNSFRIGIWFIPPNSDIDIGARERALETLDILTAGSVFGLFISGDTLSQFFHEAWKKIPKRYNHDGVPDPHGQIRLTGFTVHKDEVPDTIITRIKGYDTSAWPDVDFEVKITEMFSVSGGNVLMTNKSEVIVDTSYLHLLTLVSLISPHFPLALIFGLESAIIYFETPEPEPDEYPGVGTVAFKIIPKEIMIEGGKKVIMGYEDIEVSIGGMFTGGVADIEDRQPSIVPKGIVHVSVEPGTPQVIVQHKLITYDLRPNLVTTWSVGGHVIKTTTHTQTKPQAAISYDSGEARVLSPVFKKLKVKVTDADNLTAEQEFRVEIYAIPPPDDFPDIPPICRAKPWLPQCQDI